MQAHKLFLLSLLLLATGLSGCGESDDGTSSTPSGGGSGSNVNDPDPNLPTTGIPDLDSFDLAVQTFNVESLNWSGETSIITVRLADRLNENTVPDGTQIFFSTRGGHIDEFCELSNGECQVTWTGTSPRPADGYALVLAWTTGNESFVDLNGDGIYTDGDEFNNGVFSLRDLSEPFRDDNFNGLRDDTEEFIDYDGDSVFDPADGLFNGAFCAHSTDCSPSQFLYIWTETVIVMSGSDALIFPSVDPLVVTGGPQTLLITVTDINGNPMPAGTTVSVETSNGTINGDSSFTYSNTLFAETFSVQVESDGTSSSGPLTISVISPVRGIKTVETILVND